MESVQTAGNLKLKRDLTKEAIDLALKGEWDAASQVNREILDQFADDVDSMNRLGKALLELGQYGEARVVLDKVITRAPYNTIAKKNLARLAQLESAPTSCKQGRKPGGTPQLFIEESGKSGTTVLQQPVSRRVAATVAPGDPVTLTVEGQCIKVFTRDEEYLGKVEPKLGKRLIRLIEGGNKYTAAIIGVSERGISIIIRETYRDPRLHGVCSFPSKSKDENRLYLGEDLVRYEDDVEAEDEEGESDDESSNRREDDDRDGENEWEE
ncbi:MAG: tetratricopeptide repeat protein [SAR202 cluster bacterium]|nr:tetratricopeptide repeat protein [SAR202 cluster bacterium]